ncbi:MAG TPA: hypothetical protein VGZ47_14880 [Gemmataceae bacterium]|jgi:predicted outer membrane repeat protein|nr:hypothetical protein [Gemmataceae bacterium]
MFGKLLSCFRIFNDLAMRRAVLARSNRVRLALERLEPREVPATFNVTNLSADPSIANSLPWCINQANAVIGASDIDFAAAANLQGGIDLTQALPALQQNINLNGNGVVSINRVNDNATPNFTILTVAANKKCTIDDLTFTGGQAPRAGGAIYNSGSLTVTECEFDQNQAGSGGAIYNDVPANMTIMDTTFKYNNATLGGAIFNMGVMWINNGYFAWNTASRGGAIDNVGSLTLQAWFENNSAALEGGAVWNNGWKLSINGSTFDWNSTATPAGGDKGGGLYSVNNTSVTNTTFSNNSSSSLGGGVYVSTSNATFTGCIFDSNSSDKGGGFYVAAGTTVFTNCNFVNNKATTRGPGGCWAQGATVTRTNCTGEPDADFVADM